MSAHSFQGGRRGDNKLDLAIASLAAIAAGFLAFAMPDDVFTSLVELTGLPGVVEAARPPLGSTARIAAVATGTVFVFLAIWVLLRSLGGRPSRAPMPVSSESPVEIPRARRADAHPDAPPRRPLLAGRELGEPIADCLPVFPEQQVEHEVIAEARLEPSSAIVDDTASWLELNRVTQPEIPQRDNEADDALELRSEHEGTIQALTARLPKPRPADETSLSKLMQRLETGLSRGVAREQREAPRGPSGADQPTGFEQDQLHLSQIAAVDPTPPTLDECASAPAAEPHAGHRLRNAIQDIEKITVRR